MPEPYNPIVRTFGDLRAAILSEVDLPRHAVRPGALLDEVLPRPIRRAVWRRLEERRYVVPPLSLSGQDYLLATWAVLGTTYALVLAARHWSTIGVLVPLGSIAYRATRPHAVDLNHGAKTVGELVIDLTRFGDHRESGYRWTHDEIALKVRLIVARQAGVPLDEVRPERSFLELGMD